MNALTSTSDGETFRLQLTHCLYCFTKSARALRALNLAMRTREGAMAGNASETSTGRGGGVTCGHTRTRKHTQTHRQTTDRLQITNEPKTNYRLQTYYRHNTDDKQTSATFSASRYFFAFFLVFSAFLRKAARYVAREVFAMDWLSCCSSGRTLSLEPMRPGGG